MRLLDTTTKKIHEFLQDVPPYAILSHRWGKPSEEITFQDLQTPNWNRLEGYSKLFNACQRVRADGFKFLWLDTCCIDKTNSSELSEAINSMYKYYENAEICYAYLQDVQKTSPVDMDALKASFVRSRWFTRGWTLQELLAPRFLVFCDQTWKKLGSREDWSQEIEKASGIQPQYLENPRSCCVAMKFSWAKNRTTTRIEDQAYSLLGLFECNMPLLYGEGMLAFRRLQLELIKNHDDETIFTWYTGLGGPHIEETLLAPSPNHFSSDVVPWTFDKDRRGFSITNAGLIIHSDLWKNDNDVQYALFLNCASSWPRDHKRSPLVLPLQRVQEGSNKFVRSGTDRLRPWSEEEASRWKNHGKQDILITQRKRRETHNKPGFVVALHHPKEVSLKRVDYYNIEDGDHPQTDKRVQKLEAKNIENCVSNLEKHEVHVASKHSIIAVIELSRTQKFGVAVQPNRRSPVYGLRRLNSFRDHQELEKCFSSTEGKHCHTALSLDSQNRQIRVAMHPRPPQDRPKVAESFFAGEHIQEMVLEIVLEDLKKDEEPFYKASPVVKASSTPEVTPRKRPKITSPKFFKRRKKQSTSES